MRRHFGFVFVLVLGLVLVACGGIGTEVVGSPRPVVQVVDDADGVATAAGASASGAIVAGVVRFDGALPERQLVSPLPDPICEAFFVDGELQDERVLVDAQGGLANVFVMLCSEPPARGAVADSEVELTIDRCAFRPRALAIRKGQTLVMRSAESETTLHVFNKRSRKDRSTSGPMPGAQVPVAWKPKRAEAPFPVTCDVHAWERAHVGVFDHPFHAITDAQGRFAFPEPLPPGTHGLTLWHEHFGEQLVTVTIDDDTRRTALELRY